LGASRCRTTSGSTRWSARGRASLAVVVTASS
jgi:hypothetical protein